MTALSNNIRKFREEKNLTQQQLAEQLYVSRQTVCRWENGSRCPDLLTAGQLAHVLNVTLDDLISDEDLKDMQTKYNIWKSKALTRRQHLQELQKKILDLIQIVGAVFMAISLLLRIRFHMKVPVWCTVLFFLIVMAALSCQMIISKRLDHIVSGSSDSSLHKRKD